MVAAAGLAGSRQSQLTRRRNSTIVGSSLSLSLSSTISSSSSPERSSGSYTTSRPTRSTGAPERSSGSCTTSTRFTGLSLTTSLMLSTSLTSSSNCVLVYCRPLIRLSVAVMLYNLANKCIGDDTKAAARQSLNCIKNNKIKYGVKRFSIWRMEFLHPAMWHDHDIDFVR